VPRNFLAPYRFEIVRDGKINFLKFLKENKGNHYIDKKDQTELLLNSVNIQNNIAWGVIKYGRYGTERDVVDTITQKITKKIEARESPLDDYFYLIECDKSGKGYMVLQRTGNIGVRSAFSEALKSWGLNIKIEPILLRLKEWLNNPIMEVRIRIPKKPKDVDSRLDKIGIENEDDSFVEISIKSKRNRALQLVDKLKQSLINQQLSDIGYIYDENEEKIIVVKVGKSQRTINLTKGKLRTWIEVENLNIIKTEAENLLKELKEEEK